MIRHSHGPEFLGIGAQRSATTWLHEQLRRVPSIWLPPKKELHYFTRAETYPTPSFLASDARLKRCLSSATCDKQFRRHAVKDIVSCLRAGQLSCLAWYLRYYLGARDTEWYCRLFPNEPGLTTGEICPAYSVLSNEDIRAIHARLPELKLILLLRNPIDRLWSSYRYSGEYTRVGSDGRTQSVADFAMQDAQRLRSDYLAIIDRWTAAFGNHRLHIVYFEQIATSPEEVIRAVLDFLAIPTPQDDPNAQLKEPRNSAPQATMPEDVRVMLSRLYLPQLELMSERLGGYCSNWLQDAQRALVS